MRSDFVLRGGMAHRLATFRAVDLRCESGPRLTVVEDARFAPLATVGTNVQNHLAAFTRRGGDSRFGMALRGAPTRGIVGRVALGRTKSGTPAERGVTRIGPIALIPPFLPLSSAMLHHPLGEVDGLLRGGFIVQLYRWLVVTITDSIHEKTEGFRPWSPFPPAIIA